MLTERLKSYDPLIQRILSEAQNAGAQIEIMITTGKAISVTTFEGELDQFKHAGRSGLGVRVVMNQREGIAFTERIDETACIEVVKEAIANASICEVKPFAQIATPPPVVNNETFFADDLEKITIDDLKNVSIQMEKLARAKDSRVINIPHSGAGYSSGAVRIISSTGTDCMESSNSANAYLYVLAESGDEKRTGGDVWVGKTWDIEPEKVVEKAVQETVDLLDSKPLPISGATQLVISREAFADLLGSFTGAFSAKQVLEGRSPLKGKLKTIIASKNLTIIDDPRPANALSKSNFDSEGFPCDAVTLIQNGELQCYLQNSQTAAELQMENNARAAREPQSALGVGSTNWLVQITDKSTLTEVAKHHPQMVYVYSFQGLHAGINAISGDFSLMSEGFFYENGERAYSLKPFTVSGNFWKMLENILLACDDEKMLPCGTQLPSVLVDSLSVSG